VITIVTDIMRSIVLPGTTDRHTGVLVLVLYSVR